MNKDNPYYPNLHLKKDMFPYNTIQDFYEDVSNLYNALCRLKLLADWQAAEVENEVYEFFYSDALNHKIRDRNHIEDDCEDFTPDTLRDVYPALPEKDREAFLYTLRGVIQKQLGQPSPS